MKKEMSRRESCLRAARVGFQIVGIVAAALVFLIYENYVPLGDFLEPATIIAGVLFFGIITSNHYEMKSFLSAYSAYMYLPDDRNGQRRGTYRE